MTGGTIKEHTKQARNEGKKQRTKKKKNIVEPPEILIPATVGEGGARKRQQAAQMVTLMSSFGVPAAVLRICFLLLVSRVAVPAVLTANFAVMLFICWIVVFNVETA